MLNFEKYSAHFYKNLGFYFDFSCQSLLKRYCLENANYNQCSQSNFFCKVDTSGNTVYCCGIRGGCFAQFEAQAFSFRVRIYDGKLAGARTRARARLPFSFSSVFSVEDVGLSGLFLCGIETWTQWLYFLKDWKHTFRIHFFVRFRLNMNFGKATWTYLWLK